MSVKSVRFWKELAPLLRRFCFDSGLSVNKVVNMAVLRFLRGNDVNMEFLKLEVERVALLREEADLRERLKVILRSGSFLQDYAEKLFLGDKHEPSRLSRKREPLLGRLSGKELDVVLRILQRRETVVKELLEIEAKLLPSEKYPFNLSQEGWTVGKPKPSYEALKWPKCSGLKNWLNKKFPAGPQNYRFCTFNDKENYVENEACWTCWKNMDHQASLQDQLKSESRQRCRDIEDNSVKECADKSKGDGV